MKKLKISALTAFIIFTNMFATNLNAQTNPCGWDLNNQVSEPHCYGDCNGSIIVVPTVNWPNFEYQWSNGSLSSFIDNICADEYTVTVTDDKKCTQVFTISVGQPDELVASCITLTNESAPGASDGSIQASAVGGSGNYTFEWQTNPVTPGALLSNVPAGVYTVKVFDGKNCIATTSCEVTVDEVECVGFRTQTMGGWGQCHQNGNNPGQYLFDNFAGAFPNGLTIGCNRTLTLTSPLAVCTFLPSGSSPRVLPLGPLVDPGASYKNVFAGQLVAATLSVGFDLYDANFASNSTYTLEDLEFVSGTFAGWSVGELLAEANRKIGGCTSPYSPAQLSGALTVINENYVDGSVDKGQLVCPDSKKDENRFSNVNETSVNVSIHPNPINSAGTISVLSVNDENMTVELYNIAGQKVSSVFKGDVKAGEITKLEVDATSLNNGIYMVKVITNNQIQNIKIVVNK